MNCLNSIISQIEDANEKYLAGQSDISDSAYDVLLDNLRELKPNHELLNWIGYRNKTSWDEVKHQHIVGSLSKAKTKEELRKFLYKFPNCAFVVLEKYDGVSISLVYRDGRLVHAITRGDGQFGEDIYRNVVLMKNVKKKVNANRDFTLRGEIILFKEDFLKVNNLSNNKFSNERNAAAGIARNTDGKFCCFLTVIFYDIIVDGKIAKFLFEESKLIFLNKFFNRESPIFFERCISLYDIWQVYMMYSEKRNNMLYNIDGIVVKVDSVEIQQESGYADMRSRAAVAMKFPSQAKMSIITDIIWEVSRTGRVNPKAEIKKIRIMGADIQYVTLHNVEFIKKNRIEIGDSIIVERAGDIIPKVVRNVNYLEKGDIGNFWPKYCQSCGQELILDGKFLYCKTVECEDRVISSIVCFLNRLGIDGISSGTIGKLYMVGFTQIWQYHPANIMACKNELLKLDGIGEVTITSLINELEAKSSIEFQDFIWAIGLDSVGKRNSSKLADHFKNIGNLIRKIEEGEDKLFISLSKVFGPLISYRISKAIISSMDLIEMVLATNFFKIKEKKRVMGSISFCITGKLVNGTKGDYEKKITSAGFAYETIVNKSLTYLVANDVNGNSTKLQRARKFNVLIIDESRLNELISKDD